MRVTHDLALTGGSLADVQTGKVDPAAVAITGDRIAALGRAHGTPIPDGVRERVREFALGLDAGVYSSLYTDLTTGRRTELETLLGTVVRLGRRYGVPTPMCRAIYAALLPSELAARGRPADAGHGPQRAWSRLT